jgi:2-hydroxy-6-oxonona-2,4-dienedioate hydrolase
MDKRYQKRFGLGAVVLALAITGGAVYGRYKGNLARAYQRVSEGGTKIETSCGPVQYTEWGEGAPMLIVHGAGGGYDQGKIFAKFIGGNYRWIAPSRYGFLGTPAPEGANSRLQAEAFACLLDSLGIDQLGVVGVSMGGPSSLLFASCFPQRTRSLVLISAASHAILPRPALLAALFNLFLNDLIFWSLVRYSPSLLLMVLGVPRAVQKQLSPKETAQLRAFLGSIVPMGARRQGQTLEQQMSEFDAGQLSHIQAPTLVIHARDDTLVPFEHGEFSAKNISRAQFLPMEKGGHLAFMMNTNGPAKEKVSEFLERYNYPDGDPGWLKDSG